eukprot:CAMPEP_0184484944 /NCGR_PEP_ID=MMETSP0113_2-20130426/6605_1 /TAXON_ID=91329 /ORGANISM="Norrisiella sphaerica, Strain BC52" /LENGTH=176 /DNA_ID=CAMNT_0026866173 /DNA_START=331 /DNA_END=861 /DNA_ORIENTATION=-
MIVARQKAIPLKEFMTNAEIFRVPVFRNRALGLWDCKMWRETAVAALCLFIAAYVLGIVPMMKSVTRKMTASTSEACVCCEWVSRAVDLLKVDGSSVSNINLRCPITLDIMKDPVVCADGHTYEREAIQMWLKKNARSPQTNLPLASKDLIPNHSLRGIIHGRIIRQLLKNDGTNR